MYLFICSHQIQIYVFIYQYSYIGMYNCYIPSTVIQARHKRDKNLFCRNHIDRWQLKNKQVKK